jgi:hypothetical protein
VKGLLACVEALTQAGSPWAISFFPGVLAEAFTGAGKQGDGGGFRESVLDNGKSLAKTTSVPYPPCRDLPRQDVALRIPFLLAQFQGFSAHFVASFAGGDGRPKPT